MVYAAEFTINWISFDVLIDYSHLFSNNIFHFLLFVLLEALTIYGLVVAFALLFANPFVYSFKKVEKEKYIFELLE